MKNKSLLRVLPFTLSALFFLAGCPGTKPVKPDKPVVRLPPKPVRTAQGSFQEALSMHRQAKTSGKEEDYQNTFKLYKEAIGLKQGFVQAHYNLAAAYESAGRYRDAASHFGQVLQIKERHKGAMYRLAQVYLKQRRYGEALQRFSAYLALAPKQKKNPTMLANLAQLQLATGNHEAALRTARKILVYDPKSIVAYRLLSRVYLKQKKYPIVHLVYKLASKIKKEDASMLNTQGLAYLGQKKIPQALLTFQKATTKNPNLFAAQMNLGLLALSYYDFKRALAAFTKATTLEPRNRDAMLSYAIALRANGKYKQAETVYTQRMLPINKRDPDALLNLGILYLKFLRKPKKAKSFLRRYVGEYGSRINDNHTAYKLIKEADQLIKMNERMKQMQQQEKNRKKKPANPPPAGPAGGKAPAGAPPAGGKPPATGKPTSSKTPSHNPTLASK